VAASTFWEAQLRTGALATR